MKKAFSLIELSIVLLIIGILLAGITQSSRLIKQFRLKTAQTLTKGSPVASIKDLGLWYETSMEDSFIAAETEDTLPLSTWYDINPQSTAKNNAAQATSGNKPKYYENIFNNTIPAIRFDGANDFMTFDGTILVGSDYTIFIVEQRRDNDNESFFFGGTDSTSAANLHIGYRDTDTITQAHFASDLNYNIAAYSAPIPRIHSFMFSASAGKKYWMNGGTTPEASDSSQTTALISYAGAALGGYRSNGNYYNGDLAEIIVFTRALKIEERQAIETYLGKKYNIVIS